MANQLPDIHAGSAALQNVLAAGQNLQAAYSQATKTGDYLAKAGEIMYQQGKAMQEEEHRQWERGYKEKVFDENKRYNDWNMAQSDAKFAHELDAYYDPDAVKTRKGNANEAINRARLTGAQATEQEKLNQVMNKIGGEKYLEQRYGKNAATQGNTANTTQGTAAQENNAPQPKPQSPAPKPPANSSDLMRQQHQNKAVKGSEWTLNGGLTNNLDEANELINSLPNNQKNPSAVNKEMAAAAGNLGGYYNGDLRTRNA